MLNTILQIGKTLRKSETGLRHHRYINLAPKSDKKTAVTYLVLPVREDFTFDFENLKETRDEYLIENLFYLKYKSSDADSLMKYIWGDISYGIDKKGNEQGYYRMENPAISNAFGLSSFVRGIEDAKTFNGTAIEKFRESFSANRERIENILKENSQEKYCYLHFDFQGRHWYQFENEMNEVNKKFLKEFIGEKQNGLIILRKSLYKTLASPERFGGYVPNFAASNTYKTRTFQSLDEVMDLFYAITYSTKPVIRERDIKVIILPKGDNLKSNHIEEFFEQRKFTEIINAEEKIVGENKIENDDLDELFGVVVSDNVANEIVEFDFVFSKAGGMTSPDVDMIELSGIKRSLLAEFAHRVNDIRREVEAEREKIFGKNDKIKPLSIKMSFLNILGDVTKDKKKYQSHLLKVLPQIYSGNYYKDALLLPAFIEKVEYNIRQGKEDFKLLKFNYEFLVKIRNDIGNQKTGELDMEKMKSSNSYKAGLLLGKMAKPLSWRPIPIKTFEPKNIGFISRRVRDIYEVSKLAVEINEMLRRHKRLFQTQVDARLELSQVIDLLENESSKFDRYYCSFGFLDGYYAKPEKKEEEEYIESEEQNDIENI